MESQLRLPQPGEYWSPGTHYVCIPSLEEVRRLFGTADMEARQRKSAVYYQGLEVRQRLPQGMHDRCEEFVFAAGEFPSETDMAGLAKHLPLHYKVIRLESHRVAKADVWDLSVQRDVYWPELDHLEELYVFLHIDHLILEEDAQVIICGNVFSMECGILERSYLKSCKKPVSAQCFDIGIFPTPFSVDRNASTNTGDRGEEGIPGDHGADGHSVPVEGSLLGPFLPQGITEVDTNGKDATHGTGGGHGKRGRNGGMCRLADIRIGQLVGFENNPLRLFSQAGTGSPGGSGGNGGDGGNGGLGGNGVDAINGQIPPGNGGKGGNGGHGGNGGNGGNGGISSNIFLQLSPKDCMFVQSLSLPSIGGMAGPGGSGGLAGKGGQGGKSLNDSSKGRDGLNGQNGIEGQPGKPGKGRLGAGIFIVPSSKRLTETAITS